MEVFLEYLSAIENEEQRNTLKEVLSWIIKNFPHLDYRIAWNQPMFTDHGTYIIGFSISKQHLAISPELVGMKHFSNKISEAGYGQSKMLFKIKWNEIINYELLREIIVFNIEDKKDTKTFWRNN